MIFSVILVDTFWFKKVFQKGRKGGEMNRREGLERRKKEKGRDKRRREKGREKGMRQ